MRSPRLCKSMLLRRVFEVALIIQNIIFILRGAIKIKHTKAFDS